MTHLLGMGVRVCVCMQQPLLHCSDLQLLLHHCFTHALRTSVLSSVVVCCPLSSVDSCPFFYCFYSFFEPDRWRKKKQTTLLFSNQNTFLHIANSGTRSPEYHSLKQPNCSVKPFCSNSIPSRVLRKNTFVHSKTKTSCVYSANTLL